MPKKTPTKQIRGSIIDAMDGPFREWYEGDTWMSWRSILKGAFALPMTAEELDFFNQVAEREPPQQRVRELWVIGGRRGGKDSVASLIITYIAAMFDGKRRTVGGGYVAGTAAWRAWHRLLPCP